MTILQAFAVWALGFLVIISGVSAHASIKYKDPKLWTPKQIKSSAGDVQGFMVFWTIIWFALYAFLG